MVKLNKRELAMDENNSALSQRSPRDEARKLADAEGAALDLLRRAGAGATTAKGDDFMD
jgi:hypothetical protein